MRTLETDNQVEVGHGGGAPIVVALRLYVSGSIMASKQPSSAEISFRPVRAIQGSIAANGGQIKSSIYSGELNGCTLGFFVAGLSRADILTSIKEALKESLLLNFAVIGFYREGSWMAVYPHPEFPLEIDFDRMDRETASLIARLATAFAEQSSQ